MKEGKTEQKAETMKIWNNKTGISIPSILIQHLCIILWLLWIQILAQRPAILGFRDFPQLLHTNAEIVLQNRPQPFLSMFLPLPHSVILPFKIK